MAEDLISQYSLHFKLVECAVFYHQADDLPSQFDNNPISGIYVIHNIADGAAYVGSSNHIARRWRQHRSELNNSNHGNRALQESWDKYGINSFDFYCVELVARKELIDREQWWADSLRHHTKLCNIGDFVVSPITGLKHSQETRDKMSRSKLGRPNPVPPFSASHRLALSRAVRASPKPRNKISVIIDGAKYESIKYAAAALGTSVYIINKWKNIQGGGRSFSSYPPRPPTKARMVGSGLRQDGKDMRGGYNAKQVKVRGGVYGSVMTAARELGVTRSTIRRWVKWETAGLSAPRGHFTKYTNSDTANQLGG